MIPLSVEQIWTVDLPRSANHDLENLDGEGDVMLYALSKLVAVPTVSDDAHRERWGLSILLIIADGDA